MPHLIGSSRRGECLGKRLGLAATFTILGVVMPFAPACTSAISDGHATVTVRTLSGQGGAGGRERRSEAASDESLAARLLELHGVLPLPSPVAITRDDDFAFMRYRNSDSDLGALLQLARIGAESLNSSNDWDLFAYLRGRLQGRIADNPNVYRLAAWYMIKSNGDTQRRAAIARYIIEWPHSVPQVSVHVDEFLIMAIEEEEKFRWAMWNHAELELHVQVMLWHRLGYSQAEAFDALEGVRLNFEPVRGTYEVAVELAEEAIRLHFPEESTKRN